MDDLISILLPVLVFIESGGDPKAVGDRDGCQYKAIGLLQIHIGVVYDVNRVCGKKYTRSDRWDAEKSKEICRLYLLHWGKHYEKTTGKKATLEILARCWNGGPLGWKKKSTEKYWQKVKAQIEERSK